MPNTISNRFEGKVALIAGGAHAIETSLMGFAGLAALEIARGGGKIMIGDIDDIAGEQSAKNMREAGLTADYSHLDVTSESDWISVVEKTSSLHGHLDIMIMAAGINNRGETIETVTVPKWRQVMDVTNLGMFLGLSLIHI